MSESTDENSTLLTLSPTRAHQEQEEKDESDEETINQEARTLESYLKISGFGVFHVFLLLVSGLATAADAVEIFGVSFVVPIAEDDLNLSTGDKGWLDASIFIGTSKSIEAKRLGHSKSISCFSSPLSQTTDAGGQLEMVV